MAEPSVPYIGSRICLISKSEIRYEGTLYTINTQESTVALQHVRSFGTEGRRKDGPQIQPSAEVYEYIIFRGADIKDLNVLDTAAAPPPQPAPVPDVSNVPHGYAQPYNPYMGPPTGMMPPSGFKAAPPMQPMQQQPPYGHGQPQVPQQHTTQPQPPAAQQPVKPPQPQPQPQIPPQPKAQQQQAAPQPNPAPQQQPPQHGGNAWTQPRPAQVGGGGQQQGGPAGTNQHRGAAPGTRGGRGGAAGGGAGFVAPNPGVGGGRGGSATGAQPRGRGQIASGQFNSVEVKKMEGEFDYISTTLSFNKMAISEEVTQPAEKSYDKTKSFFDNISSESNQSNDKPYNRVEAHKLDLETFGTTSAGIRRWGGNRGGRGGRGGGGDRGGRGGGRGGRGGRGGIH